MESRQIPPAQASARQTELGDKFDRVLFATNDALQSGRIPYAMIGGIAASGLGRPRSTHDIDVFVRPEDAEAALDALDKHGFDVERTDPRWLFKGWMDEMMVDVIFKSHGDIYFDDEMQSHVRKIGYHGRDIPAVSPEDLIIIKAAVHAEVGPHHWHDALAILSHANLDWSYLLRRARRAPRRLLSLLVYAQSNDILIPNHVIQDLYRVIFEEPKAKTVAMKPAQASAQSLTRETGSPAQPSHAAESPQVAEVRPAEVQAKSACAHRQPTPYLVGHLHEALASDPRTAALDIDLAVEGGKILLRGDSPDARVREAIEEVVRRIAIDYTIDNRVLLTDIAMPEAEEFL